MSIVEFAPIRAGRSLAEALRDGFDDRSAEPGLKTLVEAYERGLILRALAATGWHQRRAAARLRVLPTTLNTKIKRLGIRLEQIRCLGGDQRPDGLLWRGRVAAGGTLEVRGLRGRVRIDTSDDRFVEVHARESGSRPDHPSVAVRIVEHPHGVSVCAVRTGAGGFELGVAESPGDDAVDLLVRVPLGIDVVASTSHGDVEVVGLSGNVEAGTTNGHVVFLPAARSASEVDL